MTELSDYKRLVSEPLERQLRAKIADLRAQLDTALTARREADGLLRQVRDTAVDVSEFTTLTGDFVIRQGLLTKIGDFLAPPANPS